MNKIDFIVQGKRGVKQISFRPTSVTKSSRMGVLEGVLFLAILAGGAGLVFLLTH
jgi:hypothetical protein